MCVMVLSWRTSSMGFVALLGTGRAGSPDESLVSFQVNILVQLTPTS